MIRIVDLLLAHHQGEIDFKDWYLRRYSTLEDLAELGFNVVEAMKEMKFAWNIFSLYDSFTPAQREEFINNLKEERTNDLG